MNIKKRINYFLKVSLTLPILLYILVNLIAGAGRKMDKPIELGNIEIPTQRTLSFHNNSDLKQKILDGWTSKKPYDWKPDEKVNLKNSRIVISCLLEGKKNRGDEPISNASKSSWPPWFSLVTLP